MPTLLRQIQVFRTVQNCLLLEFIIADLVHSYQREIVKFFMVTEEQKTDLESIKRSLRNGKIDAF